MAMPSDEIDELRRKVERDMESPGPLGTLRRGPWKAPGSTPVGELEQSTAPSAELEDDGIDLEEERELPPPRARVPRTSRQYEPPTLSAPLRDVVPKLYPEGHKSLDMLTIAKLIASACKERGTPLYHASAVTTASPRFHAYQRGAWLTVDGYQLASQCCHGLHELHAVTDGIRFKAAALGKETADGAALLEKERFHATTGDKEAVTKHLCDVLFKERSDAGAERSSMFDGAPPGIVFNNCTVTRVNGHWVRAAHSPDHRQRLALDMDYVPGAVPKQLEPVMLDWFRDCSEAEQEARIRALREFGGVALLDANTLVRRAVWLYGPGSRCGKGTFATLLTRLLPRDMVTAQTPVKLANRFVGSDSVAKLHGKRLNFGDEAGDDVGSIEQIKTIIACDPTSAREMQKTGFDFRPTCAHLFASNRLPKLPVDGPLRSRILPIAFDAPIPMHLVDRDDLEGRLLALEAAEVVSWFVDAALLMLERGGTYTEPACVERAFAEWAESSDPLEQFAATLGSTPGAPPGEPSAVAQRLWPKVSDLYAAYLEWLAANAPKAERLTLKGFGKAVRGCRRLQERAQWVKQGGAARYWIRASGGPAIMRPEPAQPSVSGRPFTAEPRALPKLPPGLPDTVQAAWVGGVWLDNPSYQAPAPQKKPAPPPKASAATAEPRTLKPAEPFGDIDFDNDN